MKSLQKIRCLVLLSYILFDHKNIIGMNQSIGDYTIFDAIEENNSNYVQRVIARGQHLNIQNDDNETPLFFAILHDREDIAIALIATRENINTPGLDGLSPLIAAIAMYNTNIVEALIAAGADVNARGIDGGTALMEAVLNNSLDMVNLIINADGFDPDQLQPIIDQLNLKENKKAVELELLDILQQRQTFNSMSLK